MNHALAEPIGAEGVTPDDGTVGMTDRLRAISDDDLLRGLAALLDHSRRIEWELVAHIGEVDERHLYAREGCSSMFGYCTSVLHLSDHEAYLRIAAGRAAREHPMLLTMLRDGRLHLSGIGKLAPELTAANREWLLERATHKSKRQIEALIADLAPRPDVPTLIRKLPDRSAAVPVAPLPVVAAVPAGATMPPAALVTSAAAPISVAVPARGGKLGPDRVAALAPLGAGRYRVQFTASAAFCDSLERLKELLIASVPDGDLARILETAVKEAVERREARRFAKAKAPRKTVADVDTAASSSRYLPAPVRRAAHESDEGSCGFVSAGGRRCGSRQRIEFHHVVPWARRGDRSPRNIRLMCRTHNAYLAARDYGEAVMARFRRTRATRLKPRAD